LCLWVQQSDDVNRANDTTCIPLNYFYTGVEEASDVASLRVWPNPADGNQVYLEATAIGRLDEIGVYDALGRLVIRYLSPEMDVRDGRCEIPVEGWSPGFYTIRVRGELGIAATRLVKP